MLLTYIVRKDTAQLISWTDGQGQNGLGKILELIAKLLSPSESESGGLVVGDLIIHLLRNAGDTVLPVLPDLIRAMTARMTTAKTASLIQVWELYLSCLSNLLCHCAELDHPAYFLNSHPSR